MTDVKAAILYEKEVAGVDHTDRIKLSVKSQTDKGAFDLFKKVKKEMGDDK